MLVLTVFAFKRKLVCSSDSGLMCCLANRFSWWRFCLFGWLFWGYTALFWRGVFIQNGGLLDVERKTVDFVLCSIYTEV